MSKVQHCAVLMAVIFCLKISLSQACDGGWLPGPNNQCYKIVTSEDQLDWLDGNDACEKIGGYLAEPLDAVVTEFLFGLATLYNDLAGVNQFFLGLSDLGREGDWKCPYSQKHPADTFWQVGRPNTSDGNNDDCAIMVLENVTFFWTDINCQLKEATAPICQAIGQDPETTTAVVTERTTTLPQPIACPNEWVAFESSCYYFSSSPLSYADAEETCGMLTDKAHLISIHSKLENDFIINQAPMGHIIGGQNTDGSWAWSDGTEFQFSNWQNGYPSDIETNSCIYVNSMGSWYNVACEQEANFICKVRVNPFLL